MVSAAPLWLTTSKTAESIPARNAVEQIDLLYFSSSSRIRFASCCAPKLGSGRPLTK